MANEKGDLTPIEGMHDKFLDTPHTIAQGLTNLMQNPEAPVTLGPDENIQQIRTLLKDEKASSLTRLAIENKIAALLNTFPIEQLSSEVLMLIFFSFSPKVRLQQSLVSRKWRLFAQDRSYWLKRLAQDFEIESNEIDDLVAPHVVYQNMMRLKYYELYRLPLTTVLHAFDNSDGLKLHFKKGDAKAWLFGLKEAADLDYLPFVIHLIEVFGLTPNETIIETAVCNGNLPLVKYLVERHSLTLSEEEYLTEAAKSGNLRLMQYLLEEVRLIPQHCVRLLEPAAESGNLLLVQYLETKQSFLDFQYENALRDAVKSGNLLLVQYLIDKHSLIPGKDILKLAAFRGSLPIVKYLVENYNFTPDQESLNSAAESGNLLLVQYLIDNHHLMPNQDTLNKASNSGNLRFVQYLIDNHHLTPNQYTLNRAAYSRNLLLVQYLIATHSLTPREEILGVAAFTGNLPLVKHLIATHSLTPSQKTLQSAVLRANLPVVKYLVEKHRLTLNQEILSLAITEGHLALVQYFIDKHRLMPDQDMLQRDACIRPYVKIYLDAVIAATQQVLIRPVNSHFNYKKKK